MILVLQREVGHEIDRDTAETEVLFDGVLGIDIKALSSQSKLQNVDVKVAGTKLVIIDARMQ